MADCHLPEVPQGPRVSSTIYNKGSRTPTRSKRIEIPINRCGLSSEEQRVDLRTREQNCSLGDSIMITNIYA
jgi:hypothetical protein